MHIRRECGILAESPPVTIRCSPPHEVNEPCLAVQQEFDAYSPEVAAMFSQVEALQAEMAALEQECQGLQHEVSGFETPQVGAPSGLSSC